MKFNSIKFETTILYTAIFGVLLIVYSSVLYLVSDAFLRQTDRQLKVKVQAVAKTLAIKNENFFPYLHVGRDYVNFVSKDRKEVFSSANLDKDLRILFMEDIQFPPWGHVTFRTLRVRHTNIRVINYPFADRTAGEYLIQVGVSQDPIRQQLRNWLCSIALLVPLIVLMTNFAGRILANRIFQPVYAIIDLAKKITQQDLSARIKAKHFDREMESLVESFNEMIAQLEDSFNHIEQFNYHAAHELKTPLTIIQGEANLLLRKDRSVSEYKQALRIIVEESQKVLITFDDLLLLTKLGDQQEVFKFEQFDFIGFFSEIVDPNRLLAAEKGIGIRMNLQNITPPLMISGDRLHLRRLFFNIIDNAVKFTPKGGYVDMRVEHSYGKIVSFITDTGPGIAPENLEKILKEFYRIDKNSLGSGLGLSIAYTIAKLHEGEIQVESRIGHGTTFKVILPCAKPIAKE